MVKFLLLQIIKAYIGAPRKKEPRSNFLVGFLAVIALIFLLLADYIYIYNAMDYVNYIGVFLKISTVLFVVAVLIKLFTLWLNQRNRERESLDVGGLSHIVTDALPILISMIPVSIVAYILWTKIQVKFSGRRERWKDSIRSLL